MSRKWRNWGVESIVLVELDGVDFEQHIFCSSSLIIKSVIIFYRHSSQGVQQIKLFSILMPDLAVMNYESIP